MTADFDGGLISSDGGVVLLCEAECRLGLAETLAGCIRDWRDPATVVHTLPAMLRSRMFAMACRTRTFSLAETWELVPRDRNPCRAVRR